MPNSITTIDEKVFLGSDKLEKIIYRGTIAQFKKTRLHIKKKWRTFSNISKIKCIDGEIDL